MARRNRPAAAGRKLVVGHDREWWLWMIPGAFLILLAILIPETRHPDRERWGRIVLTGIGLVPFLMGLLLWMRRSYVILDAGNRVLTHGWSLFGRTRLIARAITDDDQVILTRQREGMAGREVEVFHVTLDGSNDPVLLSTRQKLGEAHALAEEIAGYVGVPMANRTHGETSRRTARALDAPFFRRRSRARRHASAGQAQVARTMPTIPPGSRVRIARTKTGYVIHVGPPRGRRLRLADVLVFVGLFAVLGVCFFVMGFVGKALASVAALGLLTALVEMLTLRGRREIVQLTPEGVSVVRIRGRRRTHIRLHPWEIEDVLLSHNRDSVVLRTDQGSVLVPVSLTLPPEEARRLRQSIRVALRETYG